MADSGMAPARAAADMRRGWSVAQTFSALKHRNYRLWFAGQMISLVGTWMQNVAQPWLVYQLTHSPFYLGLIGFAPALPTLTLTLWAGVVVDRAPKRQMLVITQTIMMLSAFALTVDFFLGSIRWWHVLITALINGIAQAFDAPTRQAIVVEMVGREDMMNAIALNSAVFNSARILGPSLAGIMLALTGAGWCFFLNGVSFLAVIAGLLMMRFPPFVPRPRSDSPVSQLREALSYIRHHEIIGQLILLLSVTNLFATGYSTLIPAFASSVLNAGELGLGLMMTAIGIGALSGALLVASLGNYWRKGILLTFGNLLFPTTVLGFAFSQSLPLSLFFLTGAGFGFMIQNTTSNTLVQATVPDELRGRVMSAYMLVFNGFFPIGALIAGGVAQRFGISSGAVFGGAIALAFNLLQLWRVPQIRRLA
jgi:predicted MFS family arabinose efflux permease